MRAPRESHLRTAVVVGGSMAGLLTARVLADLVDHVTVLERDALSVDVGGRKGVPQAHHSHALLCAGKLALDRLFPGFVSELASLGVPEVDWFNDTKIYAFGQWAPKFTSPVRGIFCTRDFLEARVRNRVRQNPRIELRDQLDVEGVIYEAGEVLGVKTSGGEIRADVTVFANGRGSKLFDWTADLGYERPVETKVDSHMAYASRLVEFKKDIPRSWEFLDITENFPDEPCAGIMARVEGNRAIVTMNGSGPAAPPTDEEGWLEYVRKLHKSDIYEALQDTVPASPIYGTRNTSNRRRHLERLSRWPGRLVVLGDAACCLNPKYGQGMTAAALEALALGECILEGPVKSLPQRFHRKLSRVVDTAWLVATLGDYQTPGWSGDPAHLQHRLLHQWLNETLSITNQSDASMWVVHAEVFQFVRSPLSLFRPDILWKVARRHSQQLVSPTH